jgi:hypothetical protein
VCNKSPFNKIMPFCLLSTGRITAACYSCVYVCAAALCINKMGWDETAPLRHFIYKIYALAISQQQQQTQRVKTKTFSTPP